MVEARRDIAELKATATPESEALSPAATGDEWNELTPYIEIKIETICSPSLNISDEWHCLYREQKHQILLLPHETEAGSEVMTTK